MLEEETTEPGEAPLQGAVVMADISGSTPLYERAGNDVAAAAINARLLRMREAVEHHRGIFISAKGDDVLCWFPDPGDAVDAAYRMAAMHDPFGLTVHAGVQWGPFLQRDGDIFGTCVNMAARLCALAKSGEILLGETLFGLLGAQHRAGLVEMSPLRLKGVETEMRIFSRMVEAGGGASRTVMTDMDLGRPAPAQVEARFAFDGQEWDLQPSQSVTLGRSRENDMVVPGASVSRQHATIAINNGLVEYADHSSAGSFVQMGGGAPFSVFRRTVVLNGSGTIGLGPRDENGDRPLIQFRIVTS